MDEIFSNTVQSKISPFINFIREKQHQLEFITTIVRKSTTAYDLHQYNNTDMESLSQVTT